MPAEVGKFLSVQSLSFGQFLFLRVSHFCILYFLEFFKELRTEVDDCSQFFDSTELLYQVRYQRVFEGYTRFRESEYHEKLTLNRLIRSCVNLYQDVLLLENFANTNYLGFSKILKKHDKLTGFVTRDAFMRNVVLKRNFSRCQSLEELVKVCESIYLEITKLDR